MEKLNFLQSGKEPPHRLYHYTSVKGLEGILTSHSLWATQIHFLNDTQEFKYAVHILRQVLSELQKEYPITSKALGPSPLPSKPEELLAEFYSKIADNLVLDLVERTPICVFSLSEKGDLLSQ